ncbi:MAG: hypothetical protein QM528_09005 [Phycisphaerales bacterium]|nr:hypothetical protein [Phycisphaerales bacterium]
MKNFNVNDIGKKLERKDIKNIVGGKIKSGKLCHNRIDGLYNVCIDGCCRSGGKGFCDPNSAAVCEADAIDYCCCDGCMGCTSTDLSNCDIHD